MVRKAGWSHEKLCVRAMDTVLLPTSGINHCRVFAAVNRKK